MKIERASPYRPTGRSAAAQPAPGAASFAGLIRSSGPVAGGQQAGKAAAITASAGLMALQEVEELGARRRRAVKRAHALLDELEEVRNALLLGGLPAATLHRIRQLLADRSADLRDPALQALIREVELRTEVELAKLELAAARQR